MKKKLHPQSSIMSIANLFANSQVYDKDRPDSLISFKCTIGNGGELETKKVIMLELSMYPDTLTF